MELLLRNLKGCHRSHERDRRDGHRYHHFSEGESLVSSSSAIARHEIATLPVTLTVNFVTRPCLSRITIVVAVADRPVGWKSTSGPAVGSSIRTPLSP